MTVKKKKNKKKAKVIKERSLILFPSWDFSVYTVKQKNKDSV